MPRKLPNCAYCGEPLKDTDHRVHQFLKLGGKPEIGWHWGKDGDCIDRDPLARSTSAVSRDELVMLLRQVESRGEGRLVTNNGWLKVVSAE